MLRTLAQWLRQLGVALLIFLVTTYAILIAGSLPRTVKVYVLGVAPELLEGTLPPEPGKPSYVLTRSIEGETLRFRNDNTGWSWPPYFKFDAVDVGLQASELAQNDASRLFALRYYGFRLGMSASYPNVVSLRPAAEGPLPTPYFNWAVLSIHALGALSLGWALRRRRSRRRRHAARAGECVSPPEDATELE